MGRILALDYGRVRVGTAISDETNTIAAGDETFINNESLLDRISLLVDKYNISHMVIGLPLGYEEKPTQMSIEVKKFADNLAQELGVTYSTWNETLTSKISSKNVKKSKIDSESARIILQEYLDYQRFKL